MKHQIEGLHHVTATVDDPREDLGFYTGVLGLRLVKRTVNFDNPGVFHFYYGTGEGRPGTIMTTFPYRGKGVRIGEKGAGQVTVTSFSVPPGSLSFWQSRLAQHGVAAVTSAGRFGQKVLSFEDPSGLALELAESGQDGRMPWEAPDISPSNAIRGLHSVTLTLRDPAPTRALLEDVLGFELLAQDARRIRLGIAGGAAGRLVDLQIDPEAPSGINGIGTVHHVALAIGSEEEQRALQQQLRAAGYNVTDVRDRQYFRSIYFRERGGVLIEIATDGPGFLVDEEPDRLGHALKLPPWEEQRRSEIEAALPDITL